VGYSATKGSVLGLVRHTHPAAQLLDDEVVRDGLADHGVISPAAAGCGC